MNSKSDLLDSIKIIDETTFWKMIFEIIKMNLSRRIGIVYLFIAQFYFSQVSITTANYSQNFGTAARTSWTDNSTFSGWYLKAGGTFSYGGTQNITTAAPTNTGGFYTYQTNGDLNIKLGSRPSNTSGGSAGTGQSHIGLRLINNTGQTIESIRVLYNGFQLSLAENGTGNTNSFAFSYRISTTANVDLTTGFTSVPSLNYNAPNNSNTAGSNQVQGFPGTVSSSISSCINTASLGTGSEIMLRWTDINNTSNDHHLALDDVQVLFSFDNSCAVLLPVELINFEVNCSQKNLNLDWDTFSERNNDYFVIEGSIDGLSFEEIKKINGIGNSSQITSYSEQIENRGYEYLRLKQVDFDGVESELQTLMIPCKEDSKIATYPNPIKDILTIDNLDIDSHVKIWDSFGKLIYCERVSLARLIVDFSNHANGFYILEISKNNRVELEKLIKQY
jgi:hypothetical protein